MFTGIIKEVARVKSISKRSSFWRISITSSLLQKDAELGDSIALNGVCLTLTAKKGSLLEFEAIDPTLKKTNLKRLKSGSPVNVESSLAAGEKLGGHFVLGHVDCEAKIRKIVRNKDYFVYEIPYPASGKKYLVERGSVAVEGISLTVASLTGTSFGVNVIPFTRGHTNLLAKKAGDWVNIEFDYLLKSR